MRAPLNAVVSVTRLLAETPLMPDQREFVQTVRSGGDALLTFVNDLLDLSRLEAHKLQLDVTDFDLHEVIESSVELATLSVHDRDIDVIIDIDSSVPRGVNGDAARVRQLLVNTVGNAVKFTRHGEVVIEVHARRVNAAAETAAPIAADQSQPTVERASATLAEAAEAAAASVRDTMSEIERRGEVRSGTKVYETVRARVSATVGERRLSWPVNTPSETYEVAVVVRDTGVGIEPRHLAGLFQPYSQGHCWAAGFGGTGLGLSICKQLCELMGGGIALTSAGEGRGSTCTFSMKLLPPLLKWETAFTRPDIPLDRYLRPSKVVSLPSHKIQLSVPRVALLRATSQQQSTPLPLARCEGGPAAFLRGRQVLLAVPGAGLRGALLGHCMRFGMDVTPVPTALEAVRVLSLRPLRPRSISCPPSRPQSSEPGLTAPTHKFGYEVVVVQWQEAGDGAAQVAAALSTEPRAAVVVVCSASQCDRVRKLCGPGKPFSCMLVQPVVRAKVVSVLITLLDPSPPCTPTIPLTRTAMPGPVPRCTSMPPKRMAFDPSVTPLAPSDAVLGMRSVHPHRQLRVLGADDSPVNRKVLTMLLRRLNAEFTIVCDGHEAVEAVKRAHFDVVLLDLHMPRLSGDLAAAAIRRLMGPGAIQPVIVAVSGDTAAFDAGEAGQDHLASFDAFLEKPVLLDALRAALHKLLPDLVPSV
jgi:signal transduction histidine kinase/CheY-like chemotaxis protein